METAELQALVNRLKDVRDAANWAGKFTFEIRDATRDYRIDKIAHPVDEVIAKLETELKRRNRRRNKKRGRVDEYRPPYSD